MSSLRRTTSYLSEHPEVGLDLLRIYLGVGLFVRGILFISNRSQLLEWVAQTGEVELLLGALSYYVALAHLAGGIMLAIGLLTRIAAVAQIPVLVGAVFFVHLEEGLFTNNPNQSLEFSALVLFLLVIITLFGAGPWSADYHLERGANREEVERESGAPERHRTS